MKLTDTDTILSYYKVTTFKALRSGGIAIRKGGQWLYFTWFGGEYHLTGSTLRLEQD